MADTNSETATTDASPNSGANRQIIKPNKRKLRKRLLILLILLAIVGAVGWTLYDRLLRDQGAKEQASIEDDFKYGSIGNEANAGVPYYIWMVLPRIFPEYLPGNGGYASLGFLWEQGQETPVGFSVRTIGFPRIGHNCASCHAAPVRKQGELWPTIHLAGSSHQFDPQGYQRFLANCANDPRFTPDIIMRELDYFVKLDPIDRLLYRYVIIPQTRKGLQDLGKANAWQNNRPTWGPGRIDPFNPVKFGPLKMSPYDENGNEIDTTVGNSDMQSIWNLGHREGGPLHWDGLNSSIREVAISSAIGDGATGESIEMKRVERIEKWLKDLQAPKFPYEADPKSPYARNEAKIKEGEAIYKREKCNDCHSREGSRYAKIIPFEEVGTDPNRHFLWTDEAANTYNAYAANYPWKFNKFVGTTGPKDGYLATPLDGVWTEGPYLHNGSVPTLRDLFEPVDKRPQTFYRGNDIYDPIKGGYVSNVAQDGEKAPFFKYDVKVRGNSNMGHIYGVNLNPEEKDALVEYLKSL